MPLALWVRKGTVFSQVGQGWGNRKRELRHYFEYTVNVFHSYFKRNMNKKLGLVFWRLNLGAGLGLRAFLSFLWATSLCGCLPLPGSSLGRSAAGVPSVPSLSPSP